MNTHRSGLQSITLPLNTITRVVIPTVIQKLITITAINEWRAMQNSRNHVLNILN